MLLLITDLLAENMENTRFPKVMQKSPNNTIAKLNIKKAMGHDKTAMKCWKSVVH